PPNHPSSLSIYPLSLHDALPIFLPIYARALLSVGGGIAGDPALLMALPIAAEMGCGLLTALVAGRWIDRRGWLLPVTVGLLGVRSEEHTSELQSRFELVCRLLLE